MLCAGSSTTVVVHDVALGAAKDELPGRVTLLAYQQNGYEILFTSSLSRQGAWVIGQRTWPVGETLRVTLSEHGLFDCSAEVVWSDPQAMRLEFTAPSSEFSRAYQRVLDAPGCLTAVRQVHRVRRRQ